MNKTKIIIFFILMMLSVRIAFVLHTNYTAEDAHITFQFSRNLATGDGFALNPGEPIYGSTTPLLTFLLAGWFFISTDLVLGARIISILAILLGTIHMSKAIGNKVMEFLIFLGLSVSSQLFVEDMQGMEMALVFVFSIAAWRYFVEGRPLHAGLSAGLLLWTRVDGVIWISCVALVWAFKNRKDALIFLAVICTIYAPWIVFSCLYFGSPVPWTIIAKQVAYGIGNPTYPVHFMRIYNYLSAPLFLISLAGIWLSVRMRKYAVFSIFFIIEIAHLILTGSTFFPRYFYMLTVSSVILGSMVLFSVSRHRLIALILVSVIVVLWAYPSIAIDFAYYKNLQDGRHESLKQIGSWLNYNSSVDATVLLEPLGYVGYYADRIMFDEVGLVTPLATELHRKGIGGSEFYKYFNPDYVIWTCGEGGRSREEILNGYDLVALFDGGSYRNCYEVWKVEELIE
jgi:hypothetical protein